MYKSFFRVIVLLMICGVSASGQSRLKPSAVRFGIDLTNVGYTLFGSNHTQYELNTDLQFGKYFLAVDVGIAEKSYDNGFLYQFDGQYFRLGVDYNFLAGDPDDNMIFGGLRYARSFYSDEVKYTIENQAFGPHSYEFENSIKGRWFEIVGGMKIRVWGQLFLGYTLRYKFIKKTNGEGAFETYEMPGFGKVAKNTAMGFNYHILYRIPFKK